MPLSHDTSVSSEVEGDDATGSDHWWSGECPVSEASMCQAWLRLAQPPALIDARAKGGGLELPSDMPLSHNTSVSSDHWWFLSPPGECPVSEASSALSLFGPVKTLSYARGENTRIRMASAYRPHHPGFCGGG